MAKQAFFSKKIIECGDFTYARNGDGDIYGQHFKVKDKGTYSVESVTLSEADRLNGEEWYGSVTSKAKGPKQEVWLYTNGVNYGAWQDSDITDGVVVAKKKGVWRVISMVPATGAQIFCSDIAPATLPSRALITIDPIVANLQGNQRFIKVSIQFEIGDAK